MNLFSFDAAKNRVYWAMFFNNRLRDVGALKGEYPDPGVMRVDVVLVEMPRYYPKDPKTRRIDVNDLLDLAAAAGKIEREYERQGHRVELVFPRTWKGSVPKEIMSQRIYEALEPNEVALLPLKRGHANSTGACNHDHNLLDSIGLGLWKLGRLT